jgi:hypothetical protein
VCDGVGWCTEDWRCAEQLEKGSAAYQGSRFNVKLVCLNGSRSVAGTFDLKRVLQLAIRFRYNDPGCRIGAWEEAERTVAVAMIFSKRCSNCEILLFMRSGSEISLFDVCPLDRETTGFGIDLKHVQCSAFEVGCESILRLLRRLSVPCCWIWKWSSMK